jgi:hypothetical protein
MTKQNHLMQIERYKVLLKCLLAMAISLSLITAFLIVPQLAYAAYTSTLVGTTATLAGDAADDIIIIDVSGGNLRHNLSDPGFNSGFDWDTTVAGDQTLTNAPGVTVTINAGDGDDQIILGTNSNRASLLQASFIINGDGQPISDTLIINDSAATTARNVSVSGSSITGIGSLIINYASIEDIQISTGTGNDSITLGNGSLDNLPSVLTIDAGTSGTDSMTLFDTSDSTANTYTITPNSAQRGSVGINYNTTVDNLVVNAGTSITDSLVVTGTLVGPGVKTYSVTSSSIQRSGVATITYSVAVNNLVLNGGTTADIFNLISTSIKTTLNGDVGDDTFVFANGVTLLGGKIDGGADNDKLDYSAYATPVTVNLASSATGTTGISSIRNVTGGMDNDTLTGNTSANNINGGPGNDVLNGDWGNDSLVGGPGNDTYEFEQAWDTDTIVEDAGAGNNDSMDFSAIITQPLTITINSVNVTYGLNTATHSGNEIESVVSGSNDDTFHVNASALSSHSISIDGGPHSTGDVLNFNAAGFTVITNTTTITAAGHQPLFYTRIEQVNVTSTIPVFLPLILK